MRTIALAIISVFRKTLDFMRRNVAAERLLMRHASAWAMVASVTLVGCSLIHGAGRKGVVAHFQDGRQPVADISSVISTNARGLTAHIRNEAEPILGSEPLRIFHTLRNESDTPIELKQLIAAIHPHILETEVAKAGPPGWSERINLEPGNEVTRWIEVSRGSPDGHQGFRVNTRVQGSGLEFFFARKEVPSSFHIRVLYEDIILKDQNRGIVDFLLGTPWTEITVESNDIVFGRSSGFRR